MQLVGIVIGVIGFIIGVTGITLFWLNRIEIKKITKQVEYISEKETNKEVVVGVPNKSVKDLANSINELVRKKKESRQEHIKLEHELREAIANISHDLRTPLTSILGYVQLVEGKLNLNNRDFNIEDSLSEEEENLQKVAGYLEIIKSRAGTLNELVESFYELSKISSNDSTLELEAIHMERITCELIADFYQNFVDKNLKLQIDIPQKVSSIIGEKKSVERVIMNLLQNTLRYAKEEVEISIEETESQVMLSVTNERGEVSEEDIPFLFNRFFMANRVRSGEGTGIGLAVVKKLVELMKGEVEAKINGEKLSFVVKWCKYRGYRD